MTSFDTQTRHVLQLKSTSGIFPSRIFFSYRHLFFYSFRLSSQKWIPIIEKVKRDVESKDKRKMLSWNLKLDSGDFKWL